MKTPRHIVFFFDSLKLGGAERYGLYLAYHFKRQGHKVTVAAFDHQKESDLQNFFFDGALDYQLIEFGFEKTNHVYRIKQLIKIIPRLRALKPDILLPFTIRPNVVCSSVWKFTGAKTCIWNQQDEGFGLTSTGRDKILLWALKNASKFVSNSHKGIAIIDHITGEKYSSKSVYIPNGILVPSKNKIAAGVWRSKLNIPASAFVVLMLANLTSNKDHLTLIRAWKIFLNSVPVNEKFLVLAGRKEETFGEISALVTELGIEKTVLFTGTVNNVYELLVDSNIAVHSSRSEGVPNSVIECMSVGLPVIATKIDGHLEALGQEHELYFETENYVQLAALLARCYNKQVNLEKVGEEEQKIINEKYSIHRLYHSYEQLLNI